MRYVSFGIALLIASCLTTAQITQPEPEPLAATIFVGQVYPSGSAYLKAFDDSKPSWPRTVLLAPLLGQPAQSRPTPVEATLSRTTVAPDYIPGVEGMDDEHRACGTVPPKQKNAALKYQSDDFFDAVFDYCAANEGVSLYRSSVSPSSVKVLAFSPEMPLTNVRMVSGRRPVSSKEKQEVATQKREMERAGPCTTTPVFMDSAVRLLEAEAGNRLTVRLSSYKTPGCAGHLATIYILDFLRGQDLIRTFQTSQSHGPL